MQTHASTSHSCFLQLKFGSETAYVQFGNSNEPVFLTQPSKVSGLWLCIVRLARALHSHCRYHIETNYQHSSTLKPPRKIASIWIYEPCVTKSFPSTIYNLKDFSAMKAMVEVVKSSVRCRSVAAPLHNIVRHKRVSPCSTGMPTTKTKTILTSIFIAMKIQLPLLWYNT